MKRRMIALIILAVVCVVLCSCAKKKTNEKDAVDKPNIEQTDDNLNQQDKADNASANQDRDASDTFSEEKENKSDANPSKGSSSATTNTAKHSHSYSEVSSVAATCTSDGSRNYKCSCGKSCSERISATGHNWKSATCTEPKTCSICGATEGSAAGHNYGGGTTCTVCGHKLTMTFTGNVGSEVVLKDKLHFGEQTVASIVVDSITTSYDGGCVYIYCTPTYVMAEGTSGSTSIFCGANIYDKQGNLVKYIKQSSGLTETNIGTGAQFNFLLNVSDLTVGEYYLELLGGDYNARAYVK